MADFLVAVGTLLVAVAMLGLIWAARPGMATATLSSRAKTSDRRRVS